MDIHQLHSIGSNRTQKTYKKNISKTLFFFLRGHYATFLEYVNSVFSHVKNDLKGLRDDLKGHKDAHKKEILAVTSRLKTIETQLHENAKGLKTLGVKSTPTVLEKDTHTGGGLNIEITNTPLNFFSGTYGNFLLRKGKNDIVSRHIGSNKFWDSHLKSVIEKYADKNKSAIDIGAFIGFHTCFMAKHFANVVAFEPQPMIFNILKANILINNLNNVAPYNKCSYSKNCYMQIAKDDKQEISIPKTGGRVDYNKDFNTAALSFEVSEPTPDATEAITIDSLNLKKVGFIKVDAQGSDLQALIGAKKTIARCKPVITFEYEKELTLAHGNSLKDYETFFDQLGYSLTTLNSNEDKQIDYLAEPLRLN